MTVFIDRHRDTFGVEPICQVLEIAPSTYYTARSRPPSARAVRDEELKPAIVAVHRQNFDVYGVRKTWRQLLREGIDVGRDRVGRLMDDLGLHGATRSRRVRTTFPAAVAERPADLVDRVFSAAAPDRLWVADLERHEALSNRAVMERAPPPARRSGSVKLRAARAQGRG